MNGNRQDRFDMVILKLSTLHNFVFTDALQQLWEEALADYDIADIERALQMHMRDTEPTYKLLPATLARFITENKRDRSLQALALVEAATREVSTLYGVAFPDPIIHVVISRLGGWHSAYNSMISIDHRAIFEEDFLRAYERVSQGPKVTHPAYLPSRFNDGKFVVVGDEEAVERVLATGYNPKRPPQRVANAPSVPDRKLLAA